MAFATVRKLEGLRWEPCCVAHLGCVKSCLDYLGVGITRAWLYGGTGHAFVLNSQQGPCVSAPTAWNTRMLLDLAPNLGYRVEGIKVGRTEAGADFPRRQREAWDFVRASIDRGIPCYGWQLAVPDLYLITGYDGLGYYYAGWAADDGAGHLPWEKLGTWDVDVLEVYAVSPCAPADDVKVVRDALAAAIRHAEDPGDWILPGYTSGPAGFGLWADALEAGTAIANSSAYNADFWGECREMAVEFLCEAKSRLPGRCDGALDAAAGHYAVVRDRLRSLKALHPELPEWDWETPLTSAEGAVLMREAEVADRAGLECLKQIAALA